MPRRDFGIAVGLVVIGLLVAGGRAYYRAKYPYGQSHCCSHQMLMALECYAQDHGGKYPAGGPSPEAALCLLYTNYLPDAGILRGMTVPDHRARRILESGGRLGPDSCGWQYVPGLTKADDPGLALLWCKQPLGHNGDLTRDGGREVIFVGRGIEWISGNKWPAFLAEQKGLLSQRSARATQGVPLVAGTIELPDGTRLDRTELDCSVHEEMKGPSFSSSGTSSGTLELGWYQAPLQNGYVSRTLWFSNFISDPVTVWFTNGVPNVTNFVFRMRRGS